MVPILTWGFDLSKLEANLLVAGLIAEEEEAFSSSTPFLDTEDSSGLERAKLVSTLDSTMLSCSVLLLLLI